MVVCSRSIRFVDKTKKSIEYTCELNTTKFGQRASVKNEINIIFYKVFKIMLTRSQRKRLLEKQKIDRKVQVMKIVESLIDEINNLFNNYDINEKIDFKISNVENFDYQVNNLVKYQKHKKIEEIVDKINSLLNGHEIIDNFEITKKYFINLKINLTNCDKFLSNIEEI